MKVWALVVLPASVKLEVPDDMPIEQIREKVMEQADVIYESSGIKAVVHDSNVPELVE